MICGTHRVLYRVTHKARPAGVLRVGYPKAERVLCLCENEARN